MFGVPNRQVRGILLDPNRWLSRSLGKKVNLIKLKSFSRSGAGAIGDCGLARCRGGLLLPYGSRAEFWGWNPVRLKLAVPVCRPGESAG